MCVVVIVRLVLDPLAAYATRKSLSKMDGLQGDFDRVQPSDHSSGRGYTITLSEADSRSRRELEGTLFYAEGRSPRGGVLAPAPLHERIVATARIVEPKISILQRARARETEDGEAPPDLSTQLRRVTPLKVARVEMRAGSELLFRDLTAPRHPELWLHHLDLAAENLPTREEMAGRRPTTLSASGVVGRSGALTLFVSADPFASPLAFAGRFELRGLRVAELYQFIEPKTKLQTPRGYAGSLR